MKQKFRKEMGTICKTSDAACEVAEIEEGEKQIQLTHPQIKSTLKPMKLISDGQSINKRCRGGPISNPEF
ncbi:unnamed protein product [Urochloa humidicola]